MVLFFYFFIDVPLPNEIGEEPTVLLDSSGAEIGTLQPETSREDVSVAELPSHVVDAVLAAEDEGFYRHAGVSLPGVFRAAITNVISGDVRQGGSTISQQYVKNVTRDDARTVMRKIREAALAVKLERRFSKNEILEFYLNSIYFGRGAYGIEAAATAYFNKDAAELTEAEAIQLAGVIPAPSAFDPAENAEAAQRRFDYVRSQLVRHGDLRADEAVAPPDVTPPGSTSFHDAPFFLDMVRRELTERFGDEDAYRGLRVTTTLDREAQRAAEEAYDRRFADIEPTGAMVAVDPGTGAIRALVGGKDHTADQLNLATRPREPGSTFKPFTLAAWVEQGLSPDNYFEAPAEMTFDVATADEPWEPTNYGEIGYEEQVSVREATWYSVNTVYAQLIMEIGAEKLGDVARRAGVGERFTEVPAAVLGSDGVTPLELATGYSTFASGGIRREPTTIQRVERDDDVVVALSGDGERAFSEQVAWTVTDVLEGVVSQGTGTAADIGRPVAGKTGTSQGYGNAWFAGYTPQLTAVVWMGHRDTNRTMAGEPTGGDLPAEVWADFMASVHEDMPIEDFPSAGGSLLVTRPQPPPEPTAEDCAADEELATGEDGRAVCVASEPDGEADGEEDESSEGEDPEGDESEGDDPDGADGQTDGATPASGDGADSEGSQPDGGGSQGSSGDAQPSPEPTGDGLIQEGRSEGGSQSGGGEDAGPSDGQPDSEGGSSQPDPGSEGEPAEGQPSESPPDPETAPDSSTGEEQGTMGPNPLTGLS